jgi:hypothetical protein
VQHFDVVIIGAGAAGLMCAATAGQRGRSVLVVEHARQAGRKIRMSGGGRCNFTNLHTGPEHFLSANPHFAKSALARYTQWDFIALVERHGIAYHEKEAGQLFCDHKAGDIVHLLREECRRGGVTIWTGTEVADVGVGPPHHVETGAGRVSTESLVIATGGLSYPRMGATPFGLRLAERLGLAVQPPRPALVPLLLDDGLQAVLTDLAGVAVDAEVTAGGITFRGGVLFTHRGLSGPAILQASSYWRPGEPVTVDWLPDLDVGELLAAARRERPGQRLRGLLAEHLPRRVAEVWAALWLPDRPVAELSRAHMEQARRHLHQWTVTPAGTEGYATAEVTAGGVDTDELSSRDLQTKRYPGLHFIGEVVDVTGHLGGHNFQWAWSSGHAAGEAV